MKKIGKIVCALTLALLVVIPTCLAASNSASYYISGRGTWNGKDEGELWRMSEDEATFSASITSTETRSIAAELKYVRVMYPDSTLASLTHTGKGGSSATSQPFYPSDTDAGHYAYIRCIEGNGVKGTVSVRQ